MFQNTSKSIICLVIVVTALWLEGGQRGREVHDYMVSKL